MVKMKVHRYQVKVYESAMDIAHGMSHTQDRLLIPGQGVFAYRKKKADFFDDSSEAIECAQICIDIKSDEIKYLGEIDLPDDLVKLVVTMGKKLNEAKKEFEQSAKTLVDLVQE